MKRWCGMLVFAVILVLGFDSRAQAKEVGEATKMFQYAVEVEQSAKILEEPVVGIKTSPERISEYYFLAAKVSQDSTGRTVLENVIMYETNIQTEFTLRNSFWFQKENGGEVDVGAILIKKVVLDPRYWKITIERHAVKFSTSDHMRMMSDKWAKAQNLRVPVSTVSGGSSSTSPGLR